MCRAVLASLSEESLYPSQNHEATRKLVMLQPMPEKILQEGELAVKIYPVATELIWLCVSCGRGMTEDW